MTTQVFSIALGYLHQAVTALPSTVPPPAQLALSVASYAQQHPYVVAGQVGGLAVTLGAGLVQPALGLAGFSSAGPMAQSAAAAWQSTLGGSVAAGSAFAWCQSAAMGGAAAAGAVFTTAVTGGGIVALATAAGAVGSESMGEMAGKAKDVIMKVVGA